MIFGLALSNLSPDPASDDAQYPDFKTFSMSESPSPSQNEALFDSLFAQVKSTFKTSDTTPTEDALQMGQSMSEPCDKESWHLVGNFALGRLECSFVSVFPHFDHP